MIKKLISKLCQRVVTRTEIIDIADYPYYELLKEVNLSLIRSKGELYALRIRRDDSNLWDERKGFFSLRYYTVEIISNVVGPRTINYKDKLMLAVNVKPTFLPKRVLYVYLTTLFINALDEARKNRIENKE